MDIVDLHHDINMPMRPRTLYTARSYNHDDSAFRANHHYIEGGLGQEGFFNVNNWQAQRNVRGQDVFGFYPPDEVYRSGTSWRNSEMRDLGDATYTTSVTPQGSISLKLRESIKVEITLDGAIRVVNPKQGIYIGLSTSGNASALIHPKGKVYQYGSKVEIQARHPQGCNRYAKMWYKGVSFTTDLCASVFLVDVAGTRTTVDSFLDMGEDMTLNVFYNESNHGQAFIAEAVSWLRNAQYWLSTDGTENWIFGNVHVTQAADGFVRIRRNKNQFKIRTSPSNGSASMTSPSIHCTASMGATEHLFVRRGERRMHFDGSAFIVRNAGHSAGFDNNHELKIY